MRRINIYVIEDNLHPYNRMLSTLRSIQYDLDKVSKSKYGGIKIIGFNPSELEPITTEKECTSHLDDTFGKHPPDVIILDWELKWGFDEKNSHISYPFDGDRIIKFIDSSTEYTPYIIFTSTRANRQFPDIVEGMGLARLFPHTINLIKKSSLTLEDDQHEGHEYSIATESVRMGIDFALSKKMLITVFDFPKVEDYVFIKTGKTWERKRKNIFSISGNPSSKKEIFVGQNEIVAFLLAKEKYAVILWREGIIHLLMCHFESAGNERIRKAQVHSLFPFLRSVDFLLYNEKYFNSLRKNFYSFDVPDARGFQKFIKQIQKHVVKTDDHLAELNSDKVEVEDINPFFHAFCAFDKVEP